MAFLCPSRLGKKKKRRADIAPFLGRITGSSSVDSLVRVGLEKEHSLPPNSKMVARNQFQPYEEDEVEVLKGQEVYLLYTEKDWAYIVTTEGKEGFVPFTFLTPSQSIEPNNRNECRTPDSLAGHGITIVSEEHAPEKDQGDIVQFQKRAFGKYLVLFDFDEVNENDVSACRGEIVSILNTDDCDWWWVIKEGGLEGFLPRCYLCNVDDIITDTNTTRMEGPGNLSQRLDEESNMIELVSVGTFTAQTDEDLSLTVGEKLYVDPSTCNNAWIWAYSERSHKCGFVPRNHLCQPKQDLV